ncbi:MAG: purine-nucleoside phosphorylase [Candidatus Hydrogenedentes bacterium]|nr:purine-nucleoside phosphorylase [Candidatus Hydrogenedentota bacterium]
MEARVAIVAGSGLDFASLFDEVFAIHKFETFPGLQAGHVQGHNYRFVFGAAAGVPLVLQEGRLHPYEGLRLEAATATIPLLASWGVRTILFTNAVGGLRAALRPGALVAARSVHTWPFARYALQESLRPNFVLPGCDAEGGYWWMHGPCYETDAEIRALQSLGGSTVGMSSAPEMQVAQALGLRAGIVSCVTNSCVDKSVLTHAHVLETARRSSERLRLLLGAQMDFLAAQG